MLTIFNATLVSWYINNTVMKTTKVTFNFYLGELWKLDDTSLMDKAGIWQSPDEWNFLKVDETCKENCLMYIENDSNDTLVLGIKGYDVTTEVKVNNALGQQWIKGGPKAETEDYFTLMNFDGSKELVAISSSFLMMRGIIDKYAIYESAASLSCCLSTHRYQ